MICDCFSFARIVVFVVGNILLIMIFFGVAKVY
jgi:hypothetical protein